MDEIKITPALKRQLENKKVKYGTYADLREQVRAEAFRRREESLRDFYIRLKNRPAEERNERIHSPSDGPSLFRIEERAEWRKKRKRDRTPL